MKKLTVTSLTIAIALSCGATSAMANVIEENDMAFAFESEGSMEVATLSEQEMKETEGAFVPAWAVTAAAWTAGGGAFGGALYTYKSWSTGSSWNSRDFGRAVGAGATTGFYSSPFMRTVLSPVTRYGASGLGAASWYTW